MLEVYFIHTHCLGELMFFSSEEIIRNQTVITPAGSIDDLFDYCL